jgi:hypothetical protein
VANQLRPNKVSSARASKCACERGRGMKVEKFNLFVVITTLVVLASIVFTALSGTHIRSTEPAPYKHPCIVLKVDNQGCQTEIEMRTRIAAKQNGGFTD